MIRHAHRNQLAMRTLFVGLALIAARAAPARADLNQGLIANWCFDACTANDCWDGFHGTNYGAACVAGIVGAHAFEFTGTDIVRFIPSSWDATISNVFTVAAWIKWYGPNSFTGRSDIFDGRGDPLAGAGFLFYVSPFGKLGLWMNQPYTTVESLATVPASGSATHVAMVFDGTGHFVRAFINGQLDNTVSTSAQYHDSSHQAAIGNNHWYDGQWTTFNGVIDELRIYRRVLSAAEIQQLAGATGNQPPVAEAGGPYSGVVGAPTTFDASGSHDPDGTVVGYRWDWTNDGTWDTAWLTTPTATHTYGAPIPGQVGLIIMDDRGNTSTDTSAVNLTGRYYFVHLTDTHYGYDGARENVQSLINQILAWDWPPAFVIVTGDVLSWGYASGNLPLIAWLWAEEESNNYLAVRTDFEALATNGIPYFLCPGNHDYYNWCDVTYPWGLLSYEVRFPEFVPPYAFVAPGTPLLLVALKSGSDPFALMTDPFYPPKGTGVEDSDITWLSNLLVGEPATTVIMMHHPAISYHSASHGDDCFCWGGGAHAGAYPCDRWDAGAIHQNRGPFKDLCLARGVDLVCTGHTHMSRTYAHDMDWSDEEGDQDGFDRVYCSTCPSCPPKEWWQDCYPVSSAGPLYEFTDAAYYGGFRIIWAETDGSVTVNQASVRDDVIVGTLGGCPANLHLYDSADNHVGRSDTGGAECQRQGATYALTPLGPTEEPDPSLWEHFVEEISSPLGGDELRYELRGTADGTVRFVLDKKLADGTYTRLQYNSVGTALGSVASIFVSGGAIDYTMYVDLDGDGTIDEWVQPDTIITMNAPLRPLIPVGQSHGLVGVSYPYRVGTTDLELDSVYYRLDWGDGQESDWLGPYASGAACDGSHAWQQAGIYEVRVRAKDTWDHLSDWSETLVVTIQESPPEVVCPQPVLIECASQGGSEVQITAHVEDMHGDALSVTWWVDAEVVEEQQVPGGPPPTSADVTLLYTYGVGTHSIDVVVSDGWTAPASCSTSVTVQDTTPPVVSCSVTTDVLWAPDHHLENVGLTTTVSDECDPAGAAESLIIEVWSDETEIPDSGDGTGKHAPDAKDIYSGLRLRKERRGGEDGRVYLIIARAADGCGNVGFGYCTVVVPHDQSQAGLDQVAAQAQAALATVEATPGDTIGEKVAPLGYYQHGISEELGPHQ